MLRYQDVNHDGQYTTDDADVTEYTWDHRDRLTSVTHRPSLGAAADQVVKYSYDFANRLVRKQLDSDGNGTVDSSTALVYDGNQIVLQFDAQTSAAAGESDLTHRYLWSTAVDQILAEEQVSSSATSGAVSWPLSEEDKKQLRDRLTRSSYIDECKDHILITVNQYEYTPGHPRQVWFNTGPNPHDVRLATRVSEGLFHELVHAYQLLSSGETSEDSVLQYVNSTYNVVFHIPPRYSYVTTPAQNQYAQDLKEQQNNSNEP